MKPSIVEYTVIVLLSCGIVMLGAHDLYHKHGVREQVAGGGTRGVFEQLRHDDSARFAEGDVPDEMSSQTEDERRARYPWEAQRVKRLAEAVFGSSENEKKEAQ